MNVLVAGERRSGRALDLSAHDLDPTAVAAAVRAGTGDPADESGPGRDDLVVRCPDPGPVHDRVGVVAPDATCRVRPALAAAARSRGLTAPQADEIARLERRIVDLDVPAVSLRDARRRVAEAAGSETELRERVAALRGRVQALREADADPTDAEERLVEATRRLSEAETERIAAEQVLDRARERAESARDDRERRLRLRDRKANLEREARAHLARQVRDEFADAVAAVRDDGSVGAERDGDVIERDSNEAAAGATSEDGTAAAIRDGGPSPRSPPDGVTAALAVVRVADLDAPVVLACDRFPSAAVAADRLDAPVLYV